VSDPPARKKRARRLPPVQRREQLLDRALELLAESGAAAVTMQAVARAAGVARPVVYDFFADRAALLSALVAREESRALTDVLGVAPRLQIGSPLGADSGADFGADSGADSGAGFGADFGAGFGASLTTALQAFLEVVQGRPSTWRALLASPTGLPAEVAARLERAREATLEVVESSLRASLGARIAKLDTEVVARAVLAAGEVAARLVLTAPTEFPPARFTTFTSTLFGALARASAPAAPR